MRPTKLIIVEGIPGSGKTSTAQYVHRLIEAKGIEARLFLEGNLDHPADFEAVACLEPEEQAQVLAAFPEQRECLEQWASIQDGRTFYSFGKMGESGCPEDLCSALARFEVYEHIPLQRYYEVSLKRWQAFAARADREDALWIFECCLIQNPLTVLLAHHDRPEAEIKSHVLALAQAIQTLNPVLIYLDARNVQVTLEQVARQRPKEWLEFVIQYVTGQDYGQSLGLRGFAGMIRFYETLRRAGLEIYEQLAWNKLRLDVSSSEDQAVGWEAIHAQIKSFIETVL